MSNCLFQRFHYIFGGGGMSNRQSIWCLCQTQGVCLEAMQHKFQDKDEDLQRCSHHHFVVCFWVLDALGNWLDETRDFPDELSPPNTWGNPTRPATEWHDTAPLHGSAHRWEADSVESSLTVWTCVPNRRFHLLKQLLWAEHPVGWCCPPNAPRKQWKDRVAADVTTHLLDPLMPAASMTAERGAWRGLRCDITGINRRRDQSSEHRCISADLNRFELLVCVAVCACHCHILQTSIALILLGILVNLLGLGAKSLTMRLTRCSWEILFSGFFFAVLSMHHWIFCKQLEA